MSIYELAQLLNLDIKETLFFEAFPIDEHLCVMRFADRTDATNYYFLFDNRL